jgi:hypothetical protein
MGTCVNDLVYVLDSVLGFKREAARDHVRYVLIVNGKIIARTNFSHSWRGNQQIDDSILSLQAKQLHCSSKTLKGYCGNSWEAKHILRKSYKTDNRSGRIRPFDTWSININSNTRFYIACCDVKTCIAINRFLQNSQRYGYIVMYYFQTMGHIWLQFAKSW